MIVAADFETYYDREYSLTKMTVVEYVLDPRFQIIMLSLKIDDQPCEILIGEKAIKARLSEINFDEVAWLSHNVNFDAAILRWHFGYEPEMFLCTLSMARATTHWVLGKSSLASVSKYLGLPPKGDEVVRALGKRLESFSSEELKAYAAYCIRDNENARAIFDRLRPLFTNTELRVIDLVARMHVLPQVRLNANILAQHLAAVQSEKQQALDAVGHLPPTVFSSQLQFAALLEKHGVEVPTKISPTTGKPIYALARNDREFRELCEDPELPVQVQALLAARLQVKSTLEETRTARMLTVAQLRWPDGGGVGWLPAPLKYSAARTHRLGGDDKLNVQNLKRGSRIREAVEAPSDAYRIIHRDSSQIEARMVAWMARCQTLLKAFGEGRDVYSEFASSVYGVEVTKEDKLRRFVGKTSILGLGYGCGPVKFRHMLFIGNGGVSLKVDEFEAKRIVFHYRNMYREIPQLWVNAGGMIDLIVEKSHREPLGNWLHALGNHVPVKVGHDSIWLPNGLCLSYPELHYEREELAHESYYKNAYGGQVKLYGAKLVENLSQALARIIVTDIAVRMYDETGYHPFLSTHDSLTYCVRVEDVEWWDRRLEQEFAIVPSWAAGLPLASEGGWGRNMLAAERAVND